MILSTDSIRPDQFFDPRYTCDLDNSSPELRWSEVPEESKGFALLAEDLNGIPQELNHWSVYNIPPSVRHLPAGMAPQEVLPNGICQGVNSFGKLGYSGPCPPAGGPPHRYRFRIFSLKEISVLEPRIPGKQLYLRIQPYILCQAEITGKYQRTLQRTG